MKIAACQGPRPKAVFACVSGDSNGQTQLNVTPINSQMSLATNLYADDGRPTGNKITNFISVQNQSLGTLYYFLYRDALHKPGRL